jgi:SAM-dependent methyltransferase
MPYLFAATAFISAFLLFLVQPIIAKQILPWFGGSASVWTTCLVFFQTLLLLGYGYSHWLVHGLKPRAQTTIHILLLLFSCALLPIIAEAQWKPRGEDDPTLSILVVLTITVGLPYFILATTSPLIQAWYARSLSRVPYRLFALSNLGSLIGLLAYPFVVEPWVTTNTQSLSWSGAYIMFAVLCAFSAWASRNRQESSTNTINTAEPIRAVAAPTTRDKLLWLGLSATGSMLLIAVSNHICQNIASIPFLWIVPLALYLMTFILCFDSTGWYRRAIFLPLAAVAVIAMGATLTSLELKTAIPIHLAGLFVLCMVCHGELSQSRPAPRYLTSFFLIVSAGGMLGGFSVGIAASYLLRGYYELGLVLTLAAVLVAFSTRRMARWIPVTAAIVAIYAGYNCYSQITENAETVIASERSFYGALRVRDYGPPDNVRTLQHGAIRHGAQVYEPPSERSYPTSYYGPDSGFGITMSALRDRASPLRIGVIGLGTGTTAAYGKQKDLVRFYEINPQVINLAQKYFTYIKDSSAKVEIILGDARLSMERENDAPFDLIAVDAFSGDSIPTHLLTKEALDVYFRRLKPDGVLLIHTTNRYLDLPPVVKVLADHLGLATAIIEHEPGDEETARQQSDSDWVIVSRDRRLLDAKKIASRIAPITAHPGVSLWTDSYNNLFRILK